MRSKRLGLIFGLLLCSAAATALAAPADPAEKIICSGAPPLELRCPTVMLRGIPLDCEIVPTGDLGEGPMAVEVHDADGEVRARATLTSGTAAAVSLTPRANDQFSLVAAEAYSDPGATLVPKTIPGWWTIIPPALAILFALIFRQVVPALVAGIGSGAWILFGNPGTAALRTVDTYILGALQDGDHISIILFSMLLGGMVGIMSRSGGTAGMVKALSPWATNSRRGQVVTWAMGILIFFDDYANTLVVGNTMRPVTDRLKISREKLAYIVDSTAAPVAAIALISTWIGYEVSLIDEALTSIGSETDAYSIFLRSIPYNFYPILALLAVLLIAWSGRDFGPMLRAERRARKGQLMAEGAVPLSDFDGDALAPKPDRPHRWFNAVLPVAVVLCITFATLWITGRTALVEAGNAFGTASLAELGIQGLGKVFGEGNSFTALLYAASGGCLTALMLAIGERILTLGEALEAMIGGFKSMVTAFVILILAWGIAGVCTELHTSSFMVSALTDRLDPRLLPTLVFLFAAFTAFATGTSWGTMGILIPLAVPSAHALAMGAGFDPAMTETIMLSTVASVLAGAIFGDHCSPISDTTVLSSMASGCDHVDHVRTQLPYALFSGVLAILLGTLPVAFGVPVWICLGAGVLALVLGVRFIAQPVDA